MNNFKGAMRFLLKRCRDPFVFGLQAIFLLLFCGLSALFREQIGDEDYMISMVFTFMGAMIVVALVQLHFSDLFTARYIRNSPYYKAVITKALPAMNIITSFVVSALVITANIISIQLGLIEAATFGDTIIMCAVGCGISTAMGVSIYGFAISCFSFALIGFLSAFNDEFFGGILNSGLGLDTLTAAIIGVVLYALFCILRFTLALIFYRRRSVGSISRL